MAPIRAKCRPDLLEAVETRCTTSDGKSRAGTTTIAVEEAFREKMKASTRERWQELAPELCAALLGAVGVGDVARRNMRRQS